MQAICIQIKDIKKELWNYEVFFVFYALQNKTTLKLI